MNGSYHPYQRVRAQLNEMAAERNSDRFAECLSGMHLPAVGGNAYPADILYGGLTLSPYDPDLGATLADLAVPLCAELAQAIEAASEVELQRAVGATVDVTTGSVSSQKLLDDETYIFNLFLFISYLPKNEKLFDVLKRFFIEGFHLGVFLSGQGRAGRQLRQALIYQQTDESFESHWLGLIDSVKSNIGHLTGDNLTTLAEAWRGLLWVPPTPEDREAGRIVSIDRLDTGLTKLADVTSENPSDSLKLLRYAVRHLVDAYPRSPEFWIKEFRPKYAGWPQLLQDVADEQWPLLVEEEPAPVADLPPMTEAALNAWNGLSAEEREKIAMTAGESDVERWKKIWQDLIFAPEHKGPSWSKGLQEIKSAWEKKESSLKSRKKGHIAPDEGIAREIPARPSFKRSSFDRIAAFERVGKVLEEIALALKQHKFETAKKYLDKLIEVQIETRTKPELIAKTLSNVAALALDSQQFEWALELYERAGQKCPTDPVIMGGLADTLQKQGKYEEAEALYRQTAGRWPDNAVAHSGLADTLQKQGRYEEAEALYRQASARWPDNAVTYNGLADTFQKQGRYEEAEALYRQTAARWPDNAVTYNGLADTLQKQGRYEEAEALYRQASARWPNDAVTHSGLADTFQKQGRYEEAEALYRQTAARWPDNAVTYNGLADTLQKQGKYEEAEALYRQASARWPDNAVARNGLANTLQKQGRWEEAEALYLQTASRWPDNVVAQCGLADTLQKQGRYEESEALYRQTAVRWPNEVVAQNGLADTLQKQGRLEEAEVFYRQIAARWPDNAVPHAGLADTLQKQGRWEEAEVLYRQAAARWPDNAVPHNGLADTLQKQGRWEEAEVLYRQAAARWPDNAVPHAGLADTLQKQGKLEEAEALYRQTAARWPRDRIPRHGLANLLRKRRRFNEVLDLVPVPSSLLSVNDFYDLHLLGMIALDKKEFARAEEIFSSGLQAAKRPKDREIFQNAMGLLKLRERDYEGALRILEDNPRDAGQELKVLRLHAIAGCQQEKGARELAVQLHRTVIALHSGVKKTLQLIETAYGLSSSSGLIQPTEHQLDQIIEEEIEMLLAA